MPYKTSYFSFAFQFDIDKWLTEAKPKLSDRSKMVSAINDALVDFGLHPSEELEIVHEVRTPETIRLFKYNDNYEFVQFIGLPAASVQIFNVSVSGYV